MAKKAKSISKLKKDLWTVFSKWIKERDNWTCFTCHRKGKGSGMHAGHFISKSIGGVALYFNEKNVHAQCFNCNINLGGNTYVFGQELGEETVKELYEIKKKIVKWKPEDYLEKIKYYEKNYNNNT